VRYEVYFEVSSKFLPRLLSVVEAKLALKRAEAYKAGNRPVSSLGSKSEAYKYDIKL
jgi:hypothetical protein